MKYLFKLVLRLLFVIALLAYLFIGLIINEDPVGCTIDFFDDMYWKINNSYIL